MENEQKISEEEIIIFVKEGLNYLNLTTEEEERYIKFLQKLNNNSRYIKHKSSGIDIIGLFQERFDLTEEFFKIRFDEEKAKEYAKSTILWSDRKDYLDRLNLIRVLNCEQQVCTNIDQRTNIKRMHARNIIIREKGINLSYYSTIKLSIDDFNKKFDVYLTEIEKKYPLSDETKEIWGFIAAMDDEKFKNFFNLDRDTIARAYPTTIEELGLLKKLGNLSEEQVLKFYGISKKELLEKYPINKSTLIAVRSINNTISEANIKKMFNDTKENVLKRKNLSVELIKELAEKNNIKIKTKQKRTTK